VSTRALLKAFEPEDGERTEGREMVVAADRSRWVYHPTSTVDEPTENLALRSDRGPGRWLRSDRIVDLVLPINATLVDGARLFLTPPGAVLLVQRGYWDLDVAFTGGTASTIGLSASDLAYATEGDLLGGAAGDGAVFLTAPGVRPGTVGPKLAAGVFLVPGVEVRFNRINDAFTAGAGRAHLVCTVISNLGA
jgi:hypothetical protein